MLPQLPPYYRYALVTLISGISLPSSALALERESLERQLAAPDQLRGSFEQRHWLAEQQSRLHSTGHFLYQRERLLIWRFTSPREATLLFPKHLADRDEEVDDDALPGHELLAELLPGRVEFGRSLVDLLGGNWTALEGEYAIVLEGDAEAWQARFSPRAPVLEQALGKLILSGDASGWQSLEIHDADGDELQIEFSAVTPTLDESLSHFLGEWLQSTSEETPAAEESDAEGDEENDNQEDDVIAEEVDPEEIDEEAREVDEQRENGDSH